MTLTLEDLQRISTSSGTLPLKAYLDELKPERKRRSEMAAFGELVADYPPSDVAGAVSWLIENGLPGSGETCHSPLAFLASGGIGAVLAQYSAAREKRDRAEARALLSNEDKRARTDSERREEQEATEREVAFKQEFATPEQEDEAFRRYGSLFPMLGRNGPILRNLVISAWWADPNQLRRA